MSRNTSNGIISEAELQASLKATGDDLAAERGLAELADGALHLARRQRRSRTSAVTTAVLAVAVLGVTGGLWAGRGAQPVQAAAPSRTASSGRTAPPTVRAGTNTSILGVRSSRPGACPPGGGYPSAYGSPVCYQLDQTAGITLVHPQVRAVQMAHQWVVELTFHGANTSAVAALTRSTTITQVAIVHNGKVLSDIHLSGVPITDGKVMISGNFTKQSAAALVQDLTGR